MKKFILLTCLLSFASFKNYSRTLTDTAANIAGALELIYLDFNSLSEQSYCELVNILFDTTTSDQEKLEAIEEEPALDYFMDIFENNMGILLDNDAYSYLQVSANLSLVTDIFEDDLGDNFVPNEGCGGWKAGRRVCNSTFAAEAGAIMYLCMGNPACAALMAFLTINKFLDCHYQNDVAHPGCRDLHGGIDPNPWLIDWEPYYGDNCDF